MKKQLFLALTTALISFDSMALTNVFGGENTLDIKIAPQAFKFTYEEPNFMKDDGTFTGLEGNLRYKSSSSLMLGLDLLFASGKAKYTSKESGSVDNNPFKYSEMRILAGKSFGMITPYAGLGFRELTNDGENLKTSTGHSGYKRESSYNYIPVGFQVDFEIEKVKPFFIAEYDLFLGGMQKSYIKTDGGSIDNKQNGGHGLRIELGAQTKVHESVSMGASIFSRMWSIDKSEEVIVHDYDCDWHINEPANKTKEVGIKLFASF